MINKLYFSILFLQVNDSLFRLSSKELNEKLTQASSAVTYGAMLSSDLDVLKAESLRLEQQIMENQHNIRAIISSMEVLLDTVINPEVVLIEPVIVLDFESAINRLWSTWT